MALDGVPLNREPTFGTTATLAEPYTVILDERRRRDDPGPSGSGLRCVT